MKSWRKPWLSAVGCLGLYMLPLTMVPMGSKKAPYSRGEISPMVNLGCSVSFVVFAIVNSSQKFVARQPGPSTGPAGARFLYGFSPEAYFRWYSRKSNPISVEKPSTVSRR